MNDEPTYLNLTNNLRVFRCDDRNFEVEAFTTVKAKRGRYVDEARSTDKWVSVGFYGDLSQAVNGALKHEEARLTEKNKMDLESFVIELKKISSDLKQSVKDSGIKVSDFVKIPDNRGRKKEVKVAKSSKKESVPTVKKRGRGRPRKVKV